MDTRHIQNLKQAFEKLTPNDTQKAIMLRTILESGEKKKKKRFVMKPLFTAAGLFLIVGGIVASYNVVKRDSEQLVPLRGPEPSYTAVDSSEQDSEDLEHAVGTNPIYDDYENYEENENNEYYTTSSSDITEAIISHDTTQLDDFDTPFDKTNSDIESIISELKYVIENNKDSFNGIYNGEFNEEVTETVEKIKNYANSYYLFNNETLMFYKNEDEFTEELTEDFQELAEKHFEFQTELLKVYDEYNLIVPFDMPLKTKYYITAELGKDLWSKNYGHLGIDLSTEKGTEIYAAADGVVSEEKFNENNDFWNSNYGLCVILEHGNGLSTLYAHCSEVLVEKGQEVKKGDLIARVGGTGMAFGFHLHFEFRIFGLSFNPKIILDI